MGVVAQEDGGLAPREPKPVVPGRSFDDLGMIKSIRINSTGTKISMVCNVVDDSGEQVWIVFIKIHMFFNGEITVHR